MEFQSVQLLFQPVCASFNFNRYGVVLAGSECFLVDRLFSAGSIVFGPVPFVFAYSFGFLTNSVYFSTKSGGFMAC